MITIIDSLNKENYPFIMSAMHRLRARVFEGRLGWEVSVVDGEERDRFDDLDPAHIVTFDAEGDVVGCMRMLQTTGPHMLADVFHSILDGEPPLRSARLWEATRFCVDTEKLDTGRGPNSISSVTSEIMIGAVEFAMEAGIEDAVAVIDPVMNRILKRSGNGPYDYVGTPKQMGKVVAMAGLLDCTAERLARIRDYSGIRHDVFLKAEAVAGLEARMAEAARAKARRAGAAVPTPGTKVLPFPARATAGGRARSDSAAALLSRVEAIGHPDLRTYCFEQLRDVKDRRSLAATAALLEELTATEG